MIHFFYISLSILNRFDTFARHKDRHLSKCYELRRKYQNCLIVMNPVIIHFGGLKWIKLNILIMQSHSYPKISYNLSCFFRTKNFFVFFFKILKLGRKFFCPLFFEILNFFALFYALWIKKKPFFQFFAIVLKFWKKTKKIFPNPNVRKMFRK